ncbi:MAG: chorismate mutase [Oscillospiraceae bacterium]|nr:chorismate mutase [Oscillospiraceae bacterium]
MELEQLKQQIEDIDGQMSRLFAQRMAVSGQIAKARAAQGLLPDAAGIREARAGFQAQAGEDLEDYAGVLYNTLQDVSQSYQTALVRGKSPLCDRIAQGLTDTPPLFPEKATVACQGVEGAFAQIAVQRLFREPSISYVNRFEAVFSAIANGFCRYGVLPLENSTAGSVNKIYDLMMEYNFSIVRSVRLKVDHNLMALPGAKLEDIKEVVSHEQALAQCADFLKSHPGIRVTVCENTAVAAKLVAESGRRDLAALASHDCGALYGLQPLAEGIQDKGNNYTRFICIGKDLEIFPGADRTSIMLTVNHKPGSLYRVMARINALGINMTKLESRPLPDRDFEFMFYFDLDTSVYSPRFIQLMGDLESLCETFKYLGSYTEIV